MSALSFLTTDATSDSVLARMPTERLARAAGAHFERRDGWNVAVSFGLSTDDERHRIEETVAFVDRSCMTKLELHGEPGVLADVVASAGDGRALTPGVAARANGTRWCPVTPSRVLALGEPAGAEALRGSVAQAVSEAGGDHNVTVVDLTCGMSALSLIGPGSGELLARLCAIDVRQTVTPVAGFRPGSIARTPGYLLREDEDELLIMVGWALGEYLWQVVADAAEHLGGGPVGMDAIAERHRA